jgi:hypothetical protein
MLGQQIGESKGKRLVRRVLSTEPPKVEVSFEDSGTLMGFSGNGFGTYTATIRPDGSIFGEGEGIMAFGDGEAVTWRGTAVGKFGEGGAVSYRGMLFYRAPSQKLAALNNLCGAFEFEADPAGNLSVKVWEWK